MVGNNVLDNNSRFRINELRSALHTNVYSNPIFMNLFINIINNEYDFVANINYDPVRKLIEIKIKKSALRKDQNFSHTAQYYYNVFNPIITRILSSPQIKAELYSALNKDNIAKNTYEYICNGSIPVNLIYNLNAILDNIVIIYF